MIKDDIGTRMKDFYETVPKTKLMRRTPVAIRIDGKAFHTFTKGFKKPYDNVFMNAMHQTMKYLCENIQGCVIGYTQSDEITLILTDYKTLTSSAWFDYEVQKICSISASMATMAFNREFMKGFDEWLKNSDASPSDIETCPFYEKAIERGAMFDSRCFNIPKEEVTNLLYWRQIDASKNSIQLVGREYFSQKELLKKSCNDIQNMLLTIKDVNWNDYPDKFKRGVCCIKEEKGWSIDEHIPIFKGDGRSYVESRINFEDTE